MKYPALARERRHTVFFLREIRGFSPVFLDTEVDMTSVLRHRSEQRDLGVRYSVVAYVVHAAGRTLAKHPEANAAVRGGVNPRLARLDGVDAKVTFDKTLNSVRVVLSAVLPGVSEASLEEIQRQLEYYRDGDPATMQEFAGARLLHRLPWTLGRLAFHSGVSPLRRRAQRFGSFAVTSLGHRPVDSFHSVGGTTVTLGVGRILDRPVVREGNVVPAPILRLSLAFDHRVIDGAEAADVLADLKEALEGFSADV